MKLSSWFLRGSTLSLFLGLGSTIGIGFSNLAHDYELAGLLGVKIDDLEKLEPNDPSNPSDKFMTFSSSNVNPLIGLRTDMPLDHKNPKLGTYKHRYWVNEQSYKPGGPVFVFDVGEADGQSYANYYLINRFSFFKQLVDKFEGIGIVFEHRQQRYYGQSTPFPINKNTTALEFQYLNNDQALADLPYFAKTFRRDAFPDQDLTPKGTPWIMIGGSYAGMRAAFTRARYPDTIFAALSSSAPVQAQVDMSVYFDQVHRGLVHYGYGNCTKDIQAAYRYIDRQLERPNTAAKIKRLFLGDGAEKISNSDFTSALVVTYASWQGYGANDDLGEFCDWLETDPRTNRTAPSMGWAWLKGEKAMAERFASWPRLAKLINSGYSTNCKGLDPETPVACKIGGQAWDPTMISWTWQYCSEWGYYQWNNRGSKSMLSKYITREHWQNHCYRQFPDGLGSGHFPPLPKTRSVNYNTGGWYVRPSNVFFSGGEFDPWRSLSVLSTERFAPRGVKFSSNIPKCNTKTPSNEIFGYVIPGAQHCYDFKTEFKPADVSRQLFIDALEKWLPCFKKR
ncbi:hypothetical protein FQN57_006494 [Myotisia sp. PD_48]|nr:hypothetical protein FQN57_006494 [Myotisia sp. PD_48]